MLCFFLSWGINYRTKDEEARFERITYLTLSHPFSHCVLVAQ
jgi:hypothetical protein